MGRKHYTVLVLAYGVTSPARSEKIVIGGCDFEFIHCGFGHTSGEALRLIEHYGEMVDGIAVEGLELHEALRPWSQQTIHIRGLGRAFDGLNFHDSRKATEFWIRQALLSVLITDYRVLMGKSILSHRGSSALPLQFLREQGAQVALADALALGNFPAKFTNMESLRMFRSALMTYKSIQGAIPFGAPLIEAASREILQSWVRSSDIFISTQAWLAELGPLDFLRNKTLCVDRVDAELRRELATVEGCQVYTYLPVLSGSSMHSSLGPSTLRAVLQILHENLTTRCTIEEFALSEFLSGSAPPKLQVPRRQEKFAFVIHPLALHDIFRAPSLRWIRKTPQAFQNLSGQAIAQIPGMHYGQISGIRSELSGKECVGEIYTLGATPQELKAMPVEVLYQKLLKIAEDARKRGCSLLGLGAYTKVVGDGGETVASLSPIPVTNGNSYSAASTLWAANEMVKAMGVADLRPNAQGLRSGVAMIVGATGSIGRVSALLMAKVYGTLILVATKAQRLAKLEREIAQLHPSCQVITTTDANPYLPFCEIIITATSNLSGKSLFEMARVRPGAVICDCSRPLDISSEQAKSRPDVLVIDGGEILLPGDVRLSCDIGLPKPVVYACLAETALLVLDGRHESFSVGKSLESTRVSEVYKMGKRHGAKLAAIQGPLGVITEETVRDASLLARQRLQSWDRQFSGASMTSDIAMMIDTASERLTT